MSETMTDERLRALYAQALRARAATAGGEHPPLEAIEALARREGDEETRLATLDHVMSCAACRGELDLLRTVEQAGARSGGAATASRPGRRSWFMPAALAATVLLAVAIGIGRGALPGGNGEDVMRDGPEAGAVALVAPGTEASAGAPLLFAWRPVAGAVNYRLELLDAGGEVAFAAETADTALLAEAAARLAPGEYQWWVRAAGADASAPRSALRPLRLVAK